MYLTYEEYKGLGGKAEQSAFPTFLRKASRKLEYFTQDRIKSLEIVPDTVKECLTDFIDMMLESENGEKVSSFTTGSVSVSFADDKATDDDKMYQIALEYLPIELITMAVGV